MILISISILRLRDQCHIIHNGIPLYVVEWKLIYECSVKKSSDQLTIKLKHNKLANMLCRTSDKNRRSRNTYKFTENSLSRETIDNKFIVEEAGY